MNGWQNVITIILIIISTSVCSCSHIYLNCFGLYDFQHPWTALDSITGHDDNIEPRVVGSSLAPDSELPDIHPVLLQLSSLDSYIAILFSSPFATAPSPSELHCPNSRYNQTQPENDSEITQLYVTLIKVTIYNEIAGS